MNSVNNVNVSQASKKNPSIIKSQNYMGEEQSDANIFVNNNQGKNLVKNK